MAQTLQDRFRESSPLTMVICTFTLVLIFLFSVFNLRIVYCCGPSMLPAIADGGFYLARDIDSSKDTLHRGDILVFHPNPDTQIAYVKRVVGLPGDHLISNSGYLTVNDQYFDYIPDAGTWISCVPPGHIYFMGDNRDYSADSRVFGCIPEKLVVAKILFRIV